VGVIAFACGILSRWGSGDQPFEVDRDRREQQLDL
jgi:hypothetical protein